jgi:hypothetical protein
MVRVSAVLCLALAAGAEAAPRKGPFTTVGAHVKLNVPKVITGRVGGAQAAAAAAAKGKATAAVAAAGAAAKPAAMEVNPALKLIIGAGGIYGAFMYYGLLQERVFR